MKTKNKIKTNVTITIRQSLNRCYEYVTRHFWLKSVFANGLLLSGASASIYFEPFSWLISIHFFQGVAAAVSKWSFTSPERYLIIPIVSEARMCLLSHSCDCHHSCCFLSTALCASSFSFCIAFCVHLSLWERSPRVLLLKGNAPENDSVQSWPKHRMKSLIFSCNNVIALIPKCISCHYCYAGCFRISNKTWTPRVISAAP